MPKRRYARFIYGSAVMVWMVGMVTAATSVRSSARAQENADNGTLDVTVRVEDGVPPEQQVAWVREQMLLARQVFGRVNGMLQQARQEKDTLKITCLDDKLTQIHTSLRGAEERAKSLETSLRAGDKVTANQNFSILRIYFSRIFGLSSEAESCLGETDVVLGNTESSFVFEGDQTVDDFDPDNDGAADITEDFGAEQPGEFSGYK